MELNTSSLRMIVATIVTVQEEEEEGAGVR
jgi:hypothetical protein